VQECPSGSIEMVLRRADFGRSRFGDPAAIRGGSAGHWWSAMATEHHSRCGGPAPQRDASL